MTYLFIFSRVPSEDLAEEFRILQSKNKIRRNMKDTYGLTLQESTYAMLPQKLVTNFPSESSGISVEINPTFLLKFLLILLCFVFI